MSRRLKLAAIVFVVFAAAQLVRPERANPATDASRTIQAHWGTASGLVAVLDRACSDCHSNRIVWPWYTQIAPVSWLMAYGVTEGRKAVNFSEWTGLWQLRSAMLSQEVRAWMGLLKSARRGGFASMLAIVISGVYLMATAWGRVAWIIVTVGALVVVIVLSLALSGPRMAAIGRALATEHGAVSQAFHRLANHPLLWISIQTRVAITLGIVLLKTARPDLSGSLLIIGVAIVLGLASALPMPRRERAHEGSAD